MIVGCYDLRVTCDGVGCAAGRYGIQAAQGEYTDELGSRARSQARQRGWLLDVRNGTALCPVCVERGNKIGQESP